MFYAQLRSLALDGACRTVVRHLEAAGQRPIMLKGATIARWLYEDDTNARTYSDLDILVDPAERTAVLSLLAEVGYRPLVDEPMLRTSSVEETPLINSNGIVIDLHTTLKGIRQDPAKAWQVLNEATVPFDWFGTTVRALNLSARAMHLGLHVAQRGLVDEKAVEDLRRGLSRIGDAMWAEAFDLADLLGASGAFAAGLGLLDDGAELLERLEVTPESDREVRMRAASASVSSLFLERALAARSWRQRLRVVRGRLFPSTSWLQMHEPVATRTRWGLLRLRLIRPVRVMARLPLAVIERRAYREPPRC